MVILKQVSAHVYLAVGVYKTRFCSCLKIELFAYWENVVNFSSVDIDIIALQCIYQYVMIQCVARAVVKNSVLSIWVAVVEPGIIEICTY